MFLSLHLLRGFQVEYVKGVELWASAQGKVCGEKHCVGRTELT